MKNIARQARYFSGGLKFYRKLRFKWVARKLAGMLHCTKHIQGCAFLKSLGKLVYGERSFEKKPMKNLEFLQSQTKQAELNEQGMG